MARKAGNEQAPDQPAAAPAPGGFSQFVGRVFDQLSLSAWLPAAMLVGGSALVLQLHANRDLDLAAAIGDLSGKPLGVLIILLFSLVLATTITQAFEYEVIRVLEGYWGTGRILGLLSGIRIRRQLNRLERLKKLKARVEQRTFDRARKTILARGLIPDDQRHVLDAIEDQIYDRSDTGPSDRLQSQIDDLDWIQYARAESLRRIAAIEAAIESYPRDHRILPTRLGNVLRAAEDSIDAGADGLEGFVIRHWDDIPPGLQREHDQYRTRLDLYCLLVFVFTVLGVGAAALIDDATHAVLGRSGVAAFFVSLALVSYEAAISSARGYGTVLATVDEYLAFEPESPSRLRRLARMIGRRA
jgi:hypothetical protein